MDPFIFGRLQESIVLILAMIAVTIVAVRVLGPLARAWARKIEGRNADPGLRGDVEDLREQLGEVEGLKARMLELEERLEFTERLLAQRKDQDLLQRGGPVS